MGFNTREQRLEQNRIYGHNGSGEFLKAGTPVYVKENVNGHTVFGKSDADVAESMPAVGVLEVGLKPSEEGNIIIGGFAEITISGLSGAAVGGSLYVASGGGLSTTPSGTEQVISTILQVHNDSTVQKFIVAFGGAGAGGGGGGATITDPMPFELGNLSFGRLTGTGTFTPPAGGIGIVDFIENVLAEQVLSISAIPTSFQYNAASVNATVTPTFSASWTTATVTRTLNGVSTVIEATAVSGTPISDPISLTGFTNYTLNYTLNVTDDFGTSDSASDSIAQIGYSAPTVSSFVPARTAGASLADNETNYFREIGNFNSTVGFTTNRNSPLVDLTSVELLRGGVIDTETPSNPTHSFTHADAAAPTTGASYTYSVKMYDGSPSSPATFTAGAISFGQPVLFTTSTGAYTSGSSNSDIQTIIDGYATSAGYYKIRNNESSYTLSAKAAMNDNTKYTYIIYDSALGALTALKQGGAAGTDIVFNDLGTFTVTNQYSESLTIRVYRSPFTQAFAEDVQVYIEF
jgi:hypothetical protein